MKWSWPALKATGVIHTVDTPGGKRAGFLVRSSTSGAELGLVWGVGHAWMWRTPDGHHGERSSQTAAVRVLRDAYDLALSGRRLPRLPFDEEAQQAPEPQQPRPQSPGPKAPSRPTGPKAQGPKAQQAPRPKAPQAQGPAGPPAPAAPMKRIVWGPQAPDVTDALAALLRPSRK